MQLGRPTGRTAAAVGRPAAGLPADTRASLDRICATVELLALALDDDLAFFAGLLRRGMLDTAVEHAAHAAESTRWAAPDAALRIERSVLGPLLEARRATTVADAEPARLAQALGRALASSRMLTDGR